MLSAVIRNGHSYRAMPLAGQLVHHRSAHPGPLVLGTTPRNSPARTLDRDRTVSQRSEPSSRTALMGEQPNPWEVLPPQDATSRHRAISVVTGSCLSTDFPRCCPLCEESTVISRFVRRVSTTSPQLEVPNHAVAVNAW